MSESHTRYYSKVRGPDIQGHRNVGRAEGAEKKLRAVETYEKQKTSLPIIKPVTRRGARGLVSPEKNFAPPWKNVLDIV